MANTASAKKAIRQDVKRGHRNKIAKAEIKSLKVKLRKMIAAKDETKATEVARLISKKLDKAQAKNIYKKNTVARNKSRLMHEIKRNEESLGKSPVRTVIFCWSIFVG